MQPGDAAEDDEEHRRERERMEAFLEWHWVNNLNRGEPNSALRAQREAASAPPPAPPPPDEPPPGFDVEPPQFDLGI